MMRWSLPISATLLLGAVILAACGAAPAKTTSAAEPLASQENPAAHHCPAQSRPHAPWIHEAQLKHWLGQKKRMLLVDVRVPSMYLAGHIPGAVSEPLTKIQGGYSAFPHHEPVVLYCSCPNYEADVASQVLMQKGFHNLQVLQCGYPGWVDAHYPTVAGRQSG
ncbi:MAG: rhodanese-like domain-containing protein [Thermaerobacter sp.]|nr:rhodanese-like domain-containing protein [Thermaerobacter sp.]